MQWFTFPDITESLALVLMLIIDKQAAVDYLIKKLFAEEDKLQIAFEKASFCCLLIKCLLIFQRVEVSF